MTTGCHPAASFASAGQRSDAERRMAEVHEIHAQPLMRFLLSLTRNERSAAEDLMQETMLRVWRRSDLLPEGEENVGGGHG